jgi:hypothetical protein
MPTGGQLGSGVKIAYATATPHTWVPITQIMGEPQVPAIERDRVETTIHGTTSLRTYIPGLGDVADAEFEVLANLDSSSSHAALRNYERSQTTLWFRFEVPNESDLSTAQYVAVQIQGRVAKWVLKTPIDGAKTIQISLQFEGSYQYQNAMASAF